MKFVKGLMLGGIITTGVWMMCAENGISTKKITKTGKKWAKKMGMI